MSGLSVPKGEYEVVRVFALNMPANDAKTFVEADGGSYPLRDALGVDVLLPEGVDLVRIADLGELGLTGLLAEGHGIASKVLSGDAEKLAALSGHVVVLTSSAFGGAAADLSPGPELTFIGAYPLRKAAAAIDTLPPDRTSEPVAAPSSEAPVHAPGRVTLPWWIGAVIAGLALLLVWLLLGAAA